jgi:hypothetical protein
MRLMLALSTTAIIAVMVSCQSVPTVRTVQIDAIYLERQEPDFLKDQRSSPNPDSGYLSIDRHFYQHTRRSLEEVLRYGNYFLVSYPEDGKSASIANRMAWTSLFLVEELSPESPAFFAAYGSNLEMFNRTLFYAARSELLDQRDHWKGRANDFRNIVEQGFAEQSALFTYLQAQRLRRVEVMIVDDYEKTLREAERILTDLRLRHPHWLPGIVATDIANVSQTLRGE